MVNWKRTKNVMGLLGHNVNIPNCLHSVRLIYKGVVISQKKVWYKNSCTERYAERRRRRGGEEKFEKEQVKICCLVSLKEFAFFVMLLFYITINYYYPHLIFLGKAIIWYCDVNVPPKQFEFIRMGQPTSKYIAVHIDQT